jgi:type I restriction enzyme S subunit
MVLIAPNHIESETGRIISLETARDQGADSGKYRAKSGQVLYSKIRPALNKVAIAPVDCLCSADMYPISGRRHAVDNRFLAYWMLARPFVSYASVMSDRVKMPKVNREEVAAAPWARPPLDEQRRIADFLDAETARIDGLRSKRIAQVSVLDELELARIGEHLSAAKSTGPVYAYFDVQLGKMLNPERASGNNQQPYLRNANIQWYEINTDDMATMSFERDEWVRYGLQPGDLLVCEGGYVGQSAVWDGRMPECYFQKSLHRVRPRSHVPVEWLMYWLRYAKAIGVFEANGNVATIAHLTGEQLAQYRIPIPEDGQRRVAALNADIASVHDTKRKMEAANAVLVERRQALITAAVTGGISV